MFFYLKKKGFKTKEINGLIHKITVITSIIHNLLGAYFNSKS